VKIKFVHESAPMAIGGFDRDAQRRRDLLSAIPIGNECEHFQLAGREWFAVIGSGTYGSDALGLGCQSSSVA
jgi:hypothetical protein